LIRSGNSARGVTTATEIRTINTDLRHFSPDRQPTADTPLGRSDRSSTSFRSSSRHRLVRLDWLSPTDRAGQAQIEYQAELRRRRGDDDPPMTEGEFLDALRAISPPTTVRKGDP
jgi:hypothetical protein